MFEKILIGIDGDGGGRDAVALAHQLAGPSAAIVLAYIWELGDGATAAITGGEHPSLTGRARLQEEILAGGLDCDTTVRSATSVAAGLHEAAEELDVELLVIGSPQDQPDGRASTSSTTRAALHGAPCAVAIAPRGHAGHSASLRRIGVGYTETEIGAAALQQARELATAPGASVLLIEVIPPLPDARVGAPFAYLPVLVDAVASSMKEARTRLLSVSDVDTFVCSGLPVLRLRGLSEQLELLIVGSRSYGPLRRVLFGSTSDELAEDLACALLVLAGPRPARPAAGELVGPAAA